MITSVPPPPPSSPFPLSPSHPLHTTAQPLPHHLHILHSSPSLLPSSFPSPSPSTSLHALLLSHAPFFLFPPFLSLSPTSSLASPPPSSPPSPLLSFPFPFPFFPFPHTSSLASPPSSSASPSPSPLLLPTLPHPPTPHSLHPTPPTLAQTVWRRAQSAALVGDGPRHVRLSVPVPACGSGTAEC